MAKMLRINMTDLTIEYQEVPQEYHTLAACRKSDAQQAISKHNRKIKDTLHSR